MTKKTATVVCPTFDTLHPKTADKIRNGVMMDVHFKSYEALYEERLQKMISVDKRYLRMAFIWAENSYAKRLQVGCLIVKDKMIISDGYNGNISGFPNVCEDENNVTLPTVLHAEANALTKLAKYGNSSDGATLYVTHQPCLDCAKLIIQAGIKRVVYCEPYRLTDGLDLLEEANICVKQYKKDELV